MGLRAGTESLALISGLELALEKLVDSKGNNRVNSEIVNKLTISLRDELMKIPGIKFTGHPTKRLPNHISFLAASPQGEPIAGRDVVRLLAKNGLAVSSGTACSGGQVQDSKVLMALGISDKWLKSGIRLSLGPWNNRNQLVNVPKVIAKVLAECTTL